VIIVRSPVGFCKMMYDEAYSNDGFPPGLKKIKEGTVNPFFLFKTIILRKE